MGRLSFYLRREWLSLILATLLIGLVLNCLSGGLGPRDLLILRHHRVELTNQRDRLNAENTGLRDRIAQLQSDDAYLQHVIRQELGYVRPGEYVYRFPKAGNTAPNP